MLRLLIWAPVVAALTLVLYALLPEPEQPPIRVGVLHSLTGTMAISEKPVMEATLLAIEQINAQGGLLGRRVEAVVADGRSDERVFAREAERLIAEEHVVAIFGCWTSASRKAVKPVVEKHRNLLFYPVQYEGLEDSPNVVYLGATANQQIIPAVSWAIRHFGSRLYLLGSDYVFPRVANWLIRKQAKALGVEVVGERYLPLGSRDVNRVIDEIRRLHPSVVLNTINGDSNLAFFHALHEAGMDAKSFPVLSFSIGEAELGQFPDGQDVVGHYAAWSYFESIDTPANHTFVAGFRARYGAARRVSDPMEIAWVGVRLWAQAVRAAHSAKPGIVVQSVAHQSLLAPEGVVSIDHATHHAWRALRIGRITPERGFSVLWSLPMAIRPDPFPALATPHESARFLDQLHAGWNGHWAPVSMPTKAGAP